ncbi:MAG: carboxypeptidase-like regulatory domain-containing protein [Planctomycetes bacterium]|nr:carboxypeptidase-like regulatory domain-containing protein [Planctomycetota bacterium]
MPSWLVHPFAYELDVCVIDSLGLPVSGHTVRLGPIGCTPNLADVDTDAEGNAAIRWHGRQPQMMVEIEDPRRQRRRVRMTSGEPVRLLLLGLTRPPGRRMPIELPPHGEARFDQLSVRRPMRSGLHPFARFSDTAAEAAPLNLSNDLLADAMRETLDGLIAESDATAAIAGTVYDTEGQPCADVHVVLLGSEPQPRRRTITDEQGTFRFTQLDAGNFLVRAGGDRDGLATLPVVVTTGATTASLRLNPGRSVRGRVVGADGRPRGLRTIEWRSDDGSWVDSTATDWQGTFVIANVPDGTGSVMMWSLGDQLGLPEVVLTGVRPNHGELILRCPAGPGSTLQLQTAPRDAASTGPRLQVWHLETGLGRSIPPRGEGDSWPIGHLPAGFYDLEAWVPGDGHRVRLLSRHWIEGTTTVDLGRVELPRGGTLQFSIAEGALPQDTAQRVLELVSLREDADVFVAIDEIADDSIVHLPAGEHALLYRHSDGSPRALRFTVKAGERTEVTVAR